LGFWYLSRYPPQEELLCGRLRITLKGMEYEKPMSARRRPRRHGIGNGL
jgi:hypothetical protein